MFGKKQPPAPPFTLQVLTAEYLIEGLVPANTQLDFPEDKYEPRPLVLTTAQIQPTRPAGGPAWTAPNFTVWGHTIIAFLPHKNMAEMNQYSLWKMYDQSMMGTFYVGPYVLRGQALLLNDGAVELTQPMANLRISDPAPGSHLGEIQAQFAVVNMYWMHGYETA